MFENYIKFFIANRDGHESISDRNILLMKQLKRIVKEKITFEGDSFDSIFFNLLQYTFPQAGDFSISSMHDELENTIYKHTNLNCLVTSDFLESKLFKIFENAKNSDYAVINLSAGKKLNYTFDIDFWDSETMELKGIDFENEDLKIEDIIGDNPRALIFIALPLINGYNTAYYADIAVKLTSLAAANTEVNVDFVFVTPDDLVVSETLADVFDEVLSNVGLVKGYSDIVYQKNTVLLHMSDTIDDTEDFRIYTESGVSYTRFDQTRVTLNEWILDISSTIPSVSIPYVTGPEMRLLGKNGTDKSGILYSTLRNDFSVKGRVKASVMTLPYSYKPVFPVTLSNFKEAILVSGLQMAFEDVVYGEKIRAHCYFSEEILNDLDLFTDCLDYVVLSSEGKLVSYEMDGISFINFTDLLIKTYSLDNVDELGEVLSKYSNTQMLSVSKFKEMLNSIPLSSYTHQLCTSTGETNPECLALVKQRILDKGIKYKVF